MCYRSFGAVELNQAVRLDGTFFPPIAGKECDRMFWKYFEKHWPRTAYMLKALAIIMKLFSVIMAYVVYDFTRELRSLVARRSRKVPVETIATGMWPRK